MSEATFTEELKYDQMGHMLTEFMRQAPPWGSGRVSKSGPQNSWDQLHDALQTWGGTTKQEGSKQMAYDHIFPMSDIKITFTNGTPAKEVNQYLDPNGCHQCYVLRSKYVKLAGLDWRSTKGAQDVALVRCPKHEREYVSEIKKQLVEAISKIG